MELTGRASRGLEGFPGCENPTGRLVLHLTAPVPGNPGELWTGADVPKIIPLSSGTKGELGLQSSLYPQRDRRQCHLVCVSRSRGFGRCWSNIGGVSGKITVVAVLREERDGGRPYERTSTIFHGKIKQRVSSGDRKWETDCKDFQLIKSTSLNDPMDVSNDKGRGGQDSEHTGQA